MSFPRFQAVMDTKPAYEWEPILVTTDDDYILTLFHVWDPEKRDKTKGPVLFQHGLGDDGTGWLENSVDGQPPHTYAIEAGHDVYIGNNRGTEYSQMHKTLSATTDQAKYWDFSWDEMSLDVMANTRAMYKNAGTGKGWYVGYSQGTIQMTVALTRYESELVEYLHKVVLLAACYLTGAEREPNLTEASMSEVTDYSSIGVYAINGPTWQQDLVKICTNLPADQSFVCEFAAGKTGSPPESIKSNAHFEQN